MAVVTQEDIQNMNRLYAELKTYAAVARATGFSPGTVKKYIDPNFAIVDESKIQRFNRPLPKFDATPFRTDDWGKMCELTDEELEGLKAFWEELEL